MKTWSTDFIHFDKSLTPSEKPDLFMHKPLHHLLNLLPFIIIKLQKVFFTDLS